MPNRPYISSPSSNSPEYAELVRFLLTPLLDFPENLRVDCEWTKKNQRVWVRLALEQKDQGKVFGRGGRNLNAIRTVLNAAALAAEQSVYLDVYGEKETTAAVGQTSKPTPRSEQPKKTIRKEGKKKPQKPSKPTSNRSSDQLTPKNS
jgi:hypothetical protein